MPDNELIGSWGCTVGNGDGRRRSLTGECGGGRDIS